ncbi:MAG: hypothetical protein ACK5M7_07760 [Draconibacterium sp.]
MYTELLHAHNGFRWLVLLVLIISVVLALTGWLGKREWKKTDNLFNLLLVIFTDIQFLVGLVLYAFVSPMTKAAFQNFGAAMQNSELRFYAVEHILLMVVALALIHIGRSKSKKASSSEKKHKVATIFYTLSLVLILAGIPWSRAFF